ncbi:MAG: REP-associated tyrosine transposase [Thermoanaerobacteraceae bacterium]|nr:REP-associated tyrosine transposase [Thermoanaerobacteraceae bacterium]
MGRKPRIEYEGAVYHVIQRGNNKKYIFEDDKYLLSLLRYIHQNPLRANMTNKVEDYKWSSDGFYSIRR